MTTSLTGAQLRLDPVAPLLRRTAQESIRLAAHLLGSEAVAKLACLPLPGKQVLR